MTELFDWLLALPMHLAEAMTWLTTPISIGAFQASPLAMLGASLGAFLTIVVALKIKSLILA